jgi:hypothetical protein
MRWPRPTWPLTWHPRLPASMGDDLTGGFMVLLCGVREKPSRMVGSSQVSLKGEINSPVVVAVVSGTATVVSSVHELQLGSSAESIESVEWLVKCSMIHKKISSPMMSALKRDFDKCKVVEDGLVRPWLAMGFIRTHHIVFARPDEIGLHSAYLERGYLK